MTEQRVIVDRHFAVEGEDLSPRGGHEGVDLNEGRVFVAINLPQPFENRGDGADLLGIEARSFDKISRSFGREALERVDFVARERLGLVFGELLDLDASLFRAQRREAVRRAVEKNREVVFLGDLGALGNQDGMHRVPLDVHTEDRAGCFFGFRWGVNDPNAAGLSATADLDLGLHDQHGRVERLRGRARFQRGSRKTAVENGNAVAGE